MTKSLRLLFTLAFIFISTLTYAEGNVKISFDCAKTSWASIGNLNGEDIGTVTVTGSTIDHIEASIMCKEDADQFITFANIYGDNGSLKCYTGSDAPYELNNGFHYTLTIVAFDVPYYGVPPIATYTYDFVGTGAEATVYCDMQMTVNLQSDIFGLGYILKGTSFDVTFSEKVSRVKAWWPQGQDGSTDLTANKKSDNVWTINLPSKAMSEEGSLNIMIQAWNANGVQARGERGNGHAWGFNVLPSGGIPDGIEETINDAQSISNRVYNINGQEVKADNRGIIIKDGKKFFNK